ncbi:MAG: N-acetylmuramic acid 6-phosphate etherase [Elusimicrobiaceae bacterium]|nr:N-acetylmuramic acid 6-phosphate etherase [Elusimicrobiaceae bacterium]
MSLPLTVTETLNKNSQDFDRLPLNKMAEVMCTENFVAATAVQKVKKEIVKAVKLVEETYFSGGKIIFMGAGTSGRLGVLEAAECPPTFNTPKNLFTAIIAGGSNAVFESVEGAEDNIKQGAKDFLKIAGKKDLLVAIASSGTTPYVLSALSTAKKRGNKTVFITSNKNAKKAGATVTVCLNTGAEVISGSTRLKAGTAQKLVLNMLTTMAMARVGKIYKNYMVDLQAKNEKLKNRATRLIALAAHISLDKAKQYALKTNYSVKEAVIMAKLKVNQKQAKEILKNHKGFLRSALHE